MINANELRVGNWVMDRNDRIFQIGYWHSKDTVVALSFYDDDNPNAIKENIKSLKPIPLSHELLIYFGFKKHLDNSLWKLDENFHLHYYAFSTNEYCFSYKDFKSSSIQYLHQLQNLYYALYQKEFITII